MSSGLVIPSHTSISTPLASDNAVMSALILGVMGEAMGEGGTEGEPALLEGIMICKGALEGGGLLAFNISSNWVLSSIPKPLKPPSMPKSRMPAGGGVGAGMVCWSGMGEKEGTGDVGERERFCRITLYKYTSWSRRRRFSVFSSSMCL